VRENSSQGTARGATDVTSDPRPDCRVCGSAGTVLFDDLRDRVYEAPGTWTLRRCGTCGLVWLDPMPRASEAARLYERYYTHQDSAGDAPAAGGSGSGLRRRVMNGIAWRRLSYQAPDSAADRMLARMTSMLPPLRAGGEAAVMGLSARSGRLLDVGCGDGTLMERFRSLGWSVEGLEPDPLSAARARQRGFAVTEGTLESAPLPAGAFDAITMHHVLEHVPDPVATLAACRRLLTDGGRVAILTPNADALGARIFGEDWLHWDPPRHMHIFTVDALRRCTAAAGLTTHRLETTGRAARWAFVASTAIRRHGRLDNTAHPAGTGSATQAAGAVLSLVESLLPGAGRGEELFVVAGR
jgi:2-polyprenyl-3-methyl-5-hydroxy-6-metoxy-1,4-benzoquinol methylase